VVGRVSQTTVEESGRVSLGGKSLTEEKTLGGRWGRRGDPREHKKNTHEKKTKRKVLN